MADNKVTNNEKNVTDENFILKLSKEYTFEGKKITEIDFSGLENVTTKAMIKANKTLTNSGDVQMLPESSLHYAIIIASECTEYPIEFFEILNPKDGIAVKNRVTAFLHGVDLD